jgi:hypothetical protein
MAVAGAEPGQQQAERRRTTVAATVADRLVAAQGVAAAADPHRVRLVLAGDGSDGDRFGDHGCTSSARAWVAIGARVGVLWAVIGRGHAA